MALHCPRRGGRPGALRNKDSHPQIPWRAATRLRNHIVHGYWDIDVETLVATAGDDLPGMITQLEGAITAMEEPEGTDPSF